MTFGFDGRAVDTLDLPWSFSAGKARYDDERQVVVLWDSCCRILMVYDHPCGSLIGGSEAPLLAVF